MTTQGCPNPSSNNCPDQPQKIHASQVTLVYPFPDSEPASEEQLEIYVGTAAFVNDSKPGERLGPLGINCILNVAYDVEDLIPDVPKKITPEDPNRPGRKAFESVKYYLEYQLAKVGLFDGCGNNLMTVMSALYMAEQLVTFPPQPLNPPWVNEFTPENLLIHCHSGGSRSITVAALYIFYKYRVQNGITSLGTFTDVYRSVIDLRGPYAYNNVTAGMCSTANDIVAMYSEIFPYPVLA